MYSHEKDFFLLLHKRAQPILPPLFFFLSCPCVYIYCNICIYTLNIKSVYIMYIYSPLVCIHVYMYTRTHARTHTHTHTHTYISRARVCGPRPYTHTSVASNKTWDCICIYKYIYMYTNLYIALDPTSQDECYPDP